MRSLIYWLRHTAPDGSSSIRQYVSAHSLREAIILAGSPENYTPRLGDTNGEFGPDVDGDRYAWGVRTVETSRCENPWHKAGVGRQDLPCPECPVAAVSKYRVWAAFPAFGPNQWAPVSIAFEKHEDASRWARCLNVEFRIDEEDED